MCLLLQWRNGDSIFSFISEWIIKCGLNCNLCLVALQTVSCRGSKLGFEWPGWVSRVGRRF